MWTYCIWSIFKHNTLSGSMTFSFLLTLIALVMFNEMFSNMFLFFFVFLVTSRNLPNTHTWNVWPKFEPTTQQKQACVLLWKHELRQCASTVPFKKDRGNAREQECCAPPSDIHVPWSGYHGEVWWIIYMSTKSRDLIDWLLGFHILYMHSD